MDILHLHVLTKPNMQFKGEKLLYANTAQEHFQTWD